MISVNARRGIGILSVAVTLSISVACSQGKSVEAGAGSGAANDTAVFASLSDLFQQSSPVLGVSTVYSVDDRGYTLAFAPITFLDGTVIGAYVALPTALVPAGASDFNVHLPSLAEHEFVYVSGSDMISDDGSHVPSIAAAATFDEPLCGSVAFQSSVLNASLDDGTSVTIELGLSALAPPGGAVISSSSSQIHPIPEGARRPLANKWKCDGNWCENIYPGATDSDCKWNVTQDTGLTTIIATATCEGVGANGCAKDNECTLATQTAWQTVQNKNLGCTVTGGPPPTGWSATCTGGLSFSDTSGGASASITITGIGACTPRVTNIRHGIWSDVPEVTCKCENNATSLQNFVSICQGKQVAAPIPQPAPAPAPPAPTTTPTPTPVATADAG